MSLVQHKAACRWVLGNRQLLAESRGSHCFPKAANGKDRGSAIVSYTGPMPKVSPRVAAAIVNRHTGCLLLAGQRPIVNVRYPAVPG